MQSEFLKVGELSRRTGLSVRTLHYYDEIGLLSPSRHTDGGHRLYGAPEIRRLQQITSLRQVGFSLEEIGDFLDDPQISFERTIESHILRLEERISQQHRLRDRLQRIAKRMRSNGDVSLDELIDAIELTTMQEKYFTPRQVNQLEKRAELLGSDRIKEVQAEWEEILAGFRVAMRADTDPADPTVCALVERSVRLLEEFTGRDAAIYEALATQNRNEPAVGRRMGMDPDVMAYASRAALIMDVDPPGPTPGQTGGRKGGRRGKTT